MIRLLIQLYMLYWLINHSQDFAYFLLFRGERTLPILNISASQVNHPMEIYQTICYGIRTNVKKTISTYLNQ